MKKLKKAWQNKYFRNYIILIIVLTLAELIFRLIDNLSIISYASLRIFIGLNILALLFSFILSFLPNIIAKIFNLLISLIVSIYGIAQLGFHNFLGVYISIKVKTQASAVTSYVGDFIGSFKIHFYLMLIPFILLLVYYILFDKKITVVMPRRKVTLKLVITKILEVLIIIILSGAYYATLKLDFMQNKLQATKTYDLFRNPSTPSLAVNEFGYLGFGLLDLKSFIFPVTDEKITIEYNPEQIKLQSALEETKKLDQVNIDNDTWMDIIDNETNEVYNSLNRYFISNNPTKTNEYTSLFENKNLIVIMVESGSNLLLNEEYYPNLTKLYNEGWTWDNYYSPRNSCSTGNNEMSGMTSLYTIYDSCTANVYKNNTYFESIFNLFNKAGYTTNSFHDHYDYYYYRTIIHRNMGSQSFYKVQDMNIKYGTSYGDWANDEDMMNFYLTKLDERDTSKPFMSWITTVTSHQPYSNSSTYNDLYYDDFPTTYDSNIRRYMSKLKVVDNAIGILIDGLKERDLLEDTVIAIYCDHYPYALDALDLSEVLGYDVAVDNNVDQVPFIIYNPSLESKHYQEYTSFINLTPTLANLFGLSYDSRIYLGSDILSDEYNSMVIFADGSWKNEKAFYDITTGTIKHYTKKTYNDEEILAINEEISIKLKMSSTAIKNNYFAYLEKKLDSYTTTD